MARLPKQDALLAAVLLAVNPEGLKGINIRSLSGPDRDAFVDVLRRLLPASAPWIKVPVSVADDRLLGGLDFSATVAAGRPVFATGLLEAADGGILNLAMAERIEDGVAAIVGQVLDSRSVRIERDGLAMSRDSSFAVLAFDEGLEPEERLHSGLADRLAFHVDDVQLAEVRGKKAGVSRQRVAKAKALLPDVEVPADLVTELVTAALAFGIQSLRAELLAVEAARALAALHGRTRLEADDLSRGASLVFGVRATRLPAEPAPEPPPEPEAEQEDGEADERPRGDTLPDDVLVDAVRAAVPEGLLDLLQNGDATRRQASSGGRSGERTKSRRRGRPIGVRPSPDVGAQRLNLLATLKSAAPWQTLRGRGREHERRRLHLRKDDLHVTRYEDNVETTTIFVVDASGSQAAQRLAEVKGAIELLLADCYVRRDQVALIAFRGDSAETLLPPTRALARVKRSLAALPGGGATPLASGLDAARELAVSVRRQGRVPAVVVLTDGRANVARDGSQGAVQATDEAGRAAQLLRAEGVRSLVVDTARRPRPRAKELADAMGADYIPLPFADAATISQSVQQRVA